MIRWVEDEFEHDHEPEHENGEPMTRIYLSPPHMTGAELELVKDAFASNWIAPLGPHVTAFTPCPSSLGRGEERNSPFEKGGKGDFDLRHA